MRNQGRFRTICASMFIAALMLASVGAAQARDHEGVRVGRLALLPFEPDELETTEQIVDDVLHGPDRRLENAPGPR